MIITVLAILSLACFSNAQFGQRGPCDITVVGFGNSQLVANIPANCNNGNIHWHYTDGNLPITFQRQGSFQACFTADPAYRYRNGRYGSNPRVTFPSLQVSEITGTRLNPFTRQIETKYRFCGSFSSVLRSVTANTGGITYYMVSFPYSITDTAA